MADFRISYLNEADLLAYARSIGFVERNGLLASRQLRGVPGWQLIRIGVERC